MLTQILLFILFNLTFITVLILMVELITYKQQATALYITSDTKRGATRMTQDEYALAWQRWNWKQLAIDKKQRSSPQRSNFSSHNTCQ